MYTVTLSDNRVNKYLLYWMVGLMKRIRDFNFVSLKGTFMVMWAVDRFRRYGR